MTTQIPDPLNLFHASQYDESYDMAWGIWCDDGTRYDWLYDAADATQAWAEDVAIRCNREFRHRRTLDSITADEIDLIRQWMTMPETITVNITRMHDLRARVWVERRKGGEDCSGPIAIALQQALPDARCIMVGYEDVDIDGVIYDLDEAGRAINLSDQAPLGPVTLTPQTA